MNCGTSPEDISSFEEYMKRIRINPAYNMSGKNKQTKNSAVWVPDNSINNCTGCGVAFGYLIGRKHHCRSCGKIFCYECTKNRILLPNNIEVYPDKPENYWDLFKQKKIYKPEKVCEDCYNRIILILQTNGLILIFSYIDMKDWMIFKRVSKTWYTAVNVCKTLFQDIQNCFDECQISWIQRHMLERNIKYITGHSRYIIRYLRISNSQINDKDILGKKVMSCRQLLCIDKCNNKIMSYEWLEILYRVEFLSDELLKIGVAELMSIDNNEFKLYLPQIIYCCRTCNKDLIKLLIDKSESIDMQNYIYWCFKIMGQLYPILNGSFNKYLLGLNETGNKFEKHQQLLQGRKLFKIITENEGTNQTFGQKICKYIKKTKEGYKFADMPCYVKTKSDDVIPSEITTPIMYPLDSDYYILGFSIYDIQIKNSYTSPIVVNFYCKKGENPEEIYTKKLLVKRECIFQDFVIINIIRIMDRILKTDLQIDFGIKTYTVLPVTSGSGIIEYIDDSETIYGINKKLKKSILNYIIENNLKCQTGVWRDRFIKSTAAYCVISYLLGVGDRHLENIMISKQGYLFHIDYGYILGHDPKPVSPFIRINTDIIEAMGGQMSEGYKQFLDYCGKIYNCLRKYTSLFLNLLLIVSSDYLSIDNGKYNSESIKTEILKRFTPSMSDSQSVQDLLTKIVTSLDSTSSSVIDFWHNTVKYVKK